VRFPYPAPPLYLPLILPRGWSFLRARIGVVSLSDRRFPSRVLDNRPRCAFLTFPADSPSVSKPTFRTPPARLARWWRGILPRFPFAKSPCSRPKLFLARCLKRCFFFFHLTPPRSLSDVPLIYSNLFIMTSHVFLFVNDAKGPPTWR